MLLKLPPPEKCSNLTRHIREFWNFGNSFCGFTLAEVLVTLGIIGVVSAMTIPSLIQNHQRKTCVTQLHKVYTEVQQASLRYMADKNAINLREAGLTNSAKMKEFTNNYFKVVNDCETYVKKPCFAESYSSLSGSTKTTGSEHWSYASSVNLASGASILIDAPRCYKSTADGIESHYGHMLIDINGPKKPNIGGRDMFFVEFYDDGSIDVQGATPECKTKGACNGGSLKEIREAYYNSNCQKHAFGHGCFGKILNDNWEMNY